MALTGFAAAGSDDAAIGWFGVLEWIRQRPEYSNVIVVILTAHKESRNVDRAYRMGANSFLAKPENFDGFKQIALLLVQFWFKHNVVAERKGRL